MRFHTGHIPDPPDVVARRKGFHLLKAKRGLGTAALPLQTNNRQWLAKSAGGPGILDQHDTGSCEGHAHASGITLRFAIQQKPIPLVSPVGVYDVARMISRLPNADGSLPPLSDDGTEPGLVMQGLSEWGAVSAATWGDYPASSSTINDEPTPQEMMLAADFKLAGAYFLTASGDQYLIDLMTALAAGYPVSGAIAASGNAFQGYTGGVLGPLDDDVDHATLWVDYSWDGSNLSSLVVIGANSWGDFQWGESDAPNIAGGMYRANRDFLSKYRSATAVLDLTSSGSEQ
jgi:Papain family cysteine protease